MREVIKLFCPRIHRPIIIHKGIQALLESLFNDIRAIRRRDPLQTPTPRLGAQPLDLLITSYPHILRHRHLHREHIHIQLRLFDRRNSDGQIRIAVELLWLGINGNTRIRQSRFHQRLHAIRRQALGPHINELGDDINPVQTPQRFLGIRQLDLGGSGRTNEQQCQHHRTERGEDNVKNAEHGYRSWSFHGFIICFVSNRSGG